MWRGGEGNNLREARSDLISRTAMALTESNILRIQCDFIVPGIALMPRTLGYMAWYFRSETHLKPDYVPSREATIEITRKYQSPMCPADGWCSCAACEKKDAVDEGLELLEALHSAGYSAKYSCYAWCISQARTAPCPHNNLSVNDCAVPSWI